MRVIRAKQDQTLPSGAQNLIEILSDFVIHKIFISAKNLPMVAE